MKFLLFSDLHVSKSHSRDIVKQSQQADIVIGAGDFGSFRQGITKTIAWLSSIEKPVLLVPGNAESFEELQSACNHWQAAQVLHGNGVEVLGIEFFGIGGGIPITPFGSWSYDFTENQAKTLLHDCPRGGVLISHSPPFGILDLSSRGIHLGSTSLLETIKEKNPRLVVCGHIHESAGQQAQLDTTTVINAGPEGMWYDWQ